MSESKERFDYLLEKYTNRACSWEEYQELFMYVENSDYKEALYQFMDQKHVMPNPGTEKSAGDWDEMFNNIQKSTVKSKKSYPWYRIMAAALVLIVASLGVIGVLNDQKAQQQKQVAANTPVVQDIAPGTEKAVLTTADGSVILLDKKENRVLSQKNGNILTRTANGQLVYNNTEDIAVADGALNTLSTPRGGQYQVVLPDGSKVFLNAASSLKYPTTFKGKQRKVVLTGEAYFEISKNKEMPFVVETQNAEVKVLGTHFNIMAYADEYFSAATLLEGSIQFSREKRKYILKPGQQLKYQQKSNVEQLETADIESVMAWRKGIFVFDNTGIDEIMRSVTRWYNVEVVYRGAKPDISFTGVIPRTTNISKVLKVLQATGDIAFIIDGNKIICSKK